MEEDKDIKKLESYLNGDKIYDIELDKLIKNLIARYKELETRSDRINQQNIEYKKTLEQLQKDTIWKSKVQEILNKLSNHNYKCNFDDVDFLQNIIIEIHQLLED